MAILNIPGFAEDTGKTKTIVGGSYLVNITRQSLAGPFAAAQHPEARVLIVGAKVDPEEHEEQGGFELTKFLTIPNETMSKADFNECRRQIKSLAICCELDADSDEFATEDLVGCSCRWIVIKKLNKKSKEQQNQVVNFLPADEEANDED